MSIIHVLRGRRNPVWEREGGLRRRAGICVAINGWGSRDDARCSLRRLDGTAHATDISRGITLRILTDPELLFMLEKTEMARRKDRDIACERAATIRGKNPRAWRRDHRGNRIRYGSFETHGKYAWTLERGKPVSTAQDG